MLSSHTQINVVKGLANLTVDFLRHTDGTDERDFPTQNVSSTCAPYWAKNANNTVQLNVGDGMYTRSFHYCNNKLEF